MFNMNDAMNSMIGAHATAGKEAGDAMVQCAAYLQTANGDKQTRKELMTDLAGAIEASGRAYGLLTVLGMHTPHTRYDLNLVSKLCNKIMCGEHGKSIHYTDSDLHKSVMALLEKLAASGEAIWNSADEFGKSRSKL